MLRAKIYAIKAIKERIFMLKDLGNEIKSYIIDIESRLQSDEDKNYFEEKTMNLFDKVFEKMENLLSLREKEIKKIAKKQEITENQITELSKILDNIHKDLYEEYETFEIICPYCNFEFEAEVDETTSEVFCPECNNIIELDWNENQEDDDNNLES
jgi:hypothetical protein